MTVKKVLNVFSLVMINIIAVDSLRSLPFSAEYGFSLVFFYLLAGLMFFWPVALVSAELATAFPSKGGIYVWVREAFGEFWGFMVIWLQWVYNIAWYPTILSFIGVAIAFVIHPSLADNKAFILVLIMVVYWGATLVNFCGMKISSWVSNVGALLGTLLPMVFIIILAMIWLLTGHSSQITFSSHTFFPDFQDSDLLSFLMAILFGLVGIELSAVHADQVDDPGRSYPRAILYSTVIILVSLILSSLAIAIVVPKRELSVVTGLLQALEIYLRSFHLAWVLPIITIFIVFGGISSVATWIIGPAKGLLVAVQDGNAPEILARMN
ncbi:MAG: amino acid permease, partial [Coxiellaceae bacterium]|nr:amino acid permease [Coxiellaceae bacterium]